MQGLFSWEQQGAEDWAPYMGNVKIDPLASLKVGMNFDQKQESGFAPAQPQAVGVGGGGGAVPGVDAQGGMNPLVKKLLGKGKDEIKKYLDEWKEGKDSSFGGDGFEYNKDEWSFKDGKLSYSPVDDAMSPRNWTWDADMGRFINNTPGAWNAGKYGGSLYDPNNPFGLDDDAWAGLSGLINSGSLAEEGLGLASNAGLAGGLSDMGGVADEIVSQGGGQAGGFMGGYGKAFPIVAALKSIFDITKGGGANSGVNLVTSVASYWLPAVGLVKAFSDAVMGVGQYVKGRGRQYDYYHPYMNNQFQLEDGTRVMNIGWDDNREHALAAGSKDPNFYYDEGEGASAGYSRRGDHTLLSKDGEYYYMDIPQYLGVDDYEGYLSSNGMARDWRDEEMYGMGGTGAGDWYKEFRDSGLMSEREYSKYINDLFLHEMSTGDGIDWESAGIHKANRGMFKDRDTMGTTWEADNAKRLVGVLDLVRLMEANNDYMDLSAWADWQAPDIPTYKRPEGYYGEYDEGYYGM